MSSTFGMDPVHGDVHGDGVRASTVVFWGGVVVSLVALVLLFLPTFTSQAVTLLTGWALVAGGVVLAVTAVGSRGRGGLASALVLAAVLLAAGVLLVTDVARGTLALTAVAIIWLFVDGVVGVLVSLVRRPAAWVPMLVVSVLALGLGALLWADLPSAADWVLGIYAGIVLMGHGLTLMAAGMQMRALGE